MSVCIIFIPPQNECFGAILETACLSVRVSVRLCVRVSVCVQNTTFCQSAGGDIKPPSVTALVFLSLSTFFLSFISDQKMLSRQSSQRRSKTRLQVLCSPISMYTGWENT